MSIEVNAPVTSILGIGPATETAFNAIEGYTVLDLLRATPQQIYGAVHSLAAYEEVIEWKNQASLLQVNEVTPHLARTLVEEGIDNVDKLQRKSMDKLQQLFATTFQNGEIPQALSNEQIYAVLHDATVIAHTGMHSGTVVDDSGNPLPDCNVNCGRIETKTDAQGRFRIIRLPLGRTLPLRIEKTGYDLLLLENISINRGQTTIEVNHYTLQNLTSASASERSELDGNELPTPLGQTFREITIETSEMRNGDIFIVRNLYANGADARLSSRFKRYVNGEFLVEAVKVPLTSLPDDVDVDQHFNYDAGQFSAIEITPNKLKRIKKMKRMQNEFSGIPIPSNMSDRLIELKARANYLELIGYFKG